MNSMKGFRSTKFKSLYPSYSECGKMSLTARGALQHVLLGQHLQDAYINKNKLLDKTNPYGDIVVKSTSFPRTYESAMSFLYGFIPQLKVNMLSVEVHRNTGFCSENSNQIKSCNCERLTRTNLKISKAKRDLYAGEVLETRNIISDIFHVPDEDLQYMTSLGDALTPAYCNNLEIPCTTQSYQNINKYCVNFTVLGKVWKAVSVELSSQNREEHFVAATLKLFPLLSEISKRMKDLQESKFSPKFVLYSGHDVTVTPLLLLLGLSDGIWPRYASRVVMETLQSKANGDYYLRVLYDGEDRTAEVSFCKPYISQEGLCPLIFFIKFVQNKLLQKHGFLNYDNACTM